MGKIKLCKDCRSFVGGSCRNQMNLYIDYVNGGARTVQTPQYLRETESRCGPDARWFEPVRKEPA